MLFAKSLDHFCSLSITRSLCLLVELKSLGLVLLLLIKCANGVGNLACILCVGSCLKVFLEVADSKLGLVGNLGSCLTCDKVSVCVGREDL